MKDRIFRLLPVILTVVLLLCLAACGSTPAKDAAPTPIPEYIYTSETLCTVKSTKEDAIAAQPAIITDDGYYAIGGRYVEGKVPEGAVAETEGQFDTFIPCLSFVSNDGSVKELVSYTPIDIESDKQDCRDYRVSNRIETLRLYPDGNLALVENVYSSWCDADSEVKYGSEEYYEKLGTDSKWYLRVLDSEGKELSCAEMDIKEKDNISFYTSEIDEKGNLLTSQSDGLIAFNKEGKRAYETDNGDYIYSLAKTADGKMAAMVYDMTAYKLSVRLVDCESGELGETAYPLSLDVSGLINGSGDYDLYFSTGSSLFGYDLETQQSTKLFAWIDCDLIANSMGAVSVKPDGSVRAVSVSSDEDENSQTAELIEVKKLPYDPTAEKKHLTLATIYPNDAMMNSIIDFNRKHKDVRIDLKDYSEFNTDDDYSAGFTKLTTEIAAGNMPDILDISPDFPYNRYAANGIFVDLYPYLENDGEFSKNDFFENVLKAQEVNGGLYMASAGFSVFTAAGASSVVGEEPGITYDEYFEALSKMPEGCEGFDLGYDRDTALSMSVALEFSKLVNWSTGKCSFDSEDFIKILNYADKFGKFDSENYEYAPEDATSVRVAEGRQMLAEAIFTSVDYMLNDYDAMFGGKATIVGFPCSEGIGNMLYLSNGLAITSRCGSPDTAWEFIRTYFTEDYQKKQYQIPTNKNVFEQQLAKAMKVEYEKDANGNYKLDENGERIKKSYGYYFDGAQQVNVYAISEAQAKMLRDTIANTTRLLNFDQSIDDIVTEGAQAFFEGQKSAEECAKLIQSKVNIYVNERK